MEFTERKELEELIQYSRTFRPKDAMNQQLENASPVEDFLDFEQEPLGSYVSQQEIESYQHHTVETLMEEIKQQLLSDQQSVVPQLVLEESVPLLPELSKPTASQVESEDTAVAQQGHSEPAQAPEVAKRKDERKSEIVKPTEYQDGQTFCKVNEELLENLFAQAKGRKSLFTENIRSNSRSGIQLNQLNQGNGRQIKIFFFNSSKSIKLRVFKITTVGDVIRQAIDGYLADAMLDKSLVRFPNSAFDAYEIRLLDDDESGKADMGFAAIEKSRQILSTKSETFALIECANFVPPLEQQASKVLKEFEQFPSNKDSILVEIKDENEEEIMKTYMQIEKNLMIKDVFDALYRKNKKYNQKEYIAKIKFQQEDDYVEVDLRMPISQLTTKTITLFKKVWADQSTLKKQQSSIAQNNIIPEEQFDKDFLDAPLNENQAFNYEEFNVVKINEKNKRQERILGINQFRIYNKSSKKANFFGKLFTNSETGTKFPERLIEDIIDIKVVHHFINITFRQDGSLFFIDFQGLKEQKSSNSIPWIPRWPRRLMLNFSSLGRVASSQRSEHKV